MTNKAIGVAQQLMKNGISYNSDNIMTSIGEVIISGKTVTLKALGKSGYNTIRLWYSKSGAAANITLDLAVDSKTYTLLAWQTLLWDLEANTIKQIAYGATLPKYYLILAICGIDTITSGYLVDMYTLAKSQKSGSADLNSYLLPNVSEKFKKVVDTSKTNIDICNLAYMTDSHINGTVGTEGYKVVNELTNSLGIDTVVSGGDNIVYVQDKNRALLEHVKFIKRLKPKLLYAVGNHDSNAWEQTGHNQPISEIITTEELYTIYGKKYSNEFQWGSKTDLYYFYDVPNTNVRVITLNSIDVPIIDNGDGTTKYNPGKTFGVRQQQMEWLAQTALNTDRHVLINIHISPVRSGEGIYYNSQIYNYDKLRGLLEAFKNGTSYTLTSTNDRPEFDINLTGSFSSLGNIIGVISGHIHLDNNVVINGINYIARNCDWSQSWTATVPDKDGVVPTIPPRVIGTDSELAVDVLSIDTTSKKMYITRFGNVGTDLTLPY